MRSRWPSRFLIAVRATAMCGLLLFTNSARGQQPNDQAPATKTETNSDGLPDSPVAQSDSSRSSARHLSFGERFHLYEHSLLEPQSIIAPALGASIDQGLDTPSQWGQGADGFGRRFGSAYAREVIARTMPALTAPHSSLTPGIQGHRRMLRTPWSVVQSR